MNDETGPKEIIIVKRRPSVGDDGHHGGVWKIAFADFMTAMMAFFLVLWIVNSTSKETQAAIARHFNPLKITDTVPAPRGLRDPRDTDFDASLDEATKEVPKRLSSGALFSEGSKEPTSDAALEAAREGNSSSIR